ncbi:MAG: CPBP family intramembrane glutamic endopeptidase, partial [Pseudomonadota bacterium]
FPAGRERIGEDALRHLAQLLGLSLAVVIMLSGLVGGIIASTNGGVPDNVNAQLAQTNPAMLLMLAVLFAPILEEVIFRSWLGGPKACLLGLPVLASLAAVAASATGPVPTILSFGLTGFLCAMIIAISGQYEKRSPEGQKLARWQLFPVAFYGSTAFFALLHLSNYEGGLSSPVMLLAVVPQFLIGAVLGYVRMRFGLVPAIWFHAIYNLVLVGLFIVSQSLAPVEADAAAMLLLRPLEALVGTLSSA